jgi:superfamily II DNA or RNA helicase
LGVANTGFGKTVALSAVVGETINGNGKRAAVIAHRDELTVQNSKTFKRVCPDVPISFYTADRKSWRGRSTFSMVQTLSRSEHLEDMPPLDLLVFDEAHHVAAESYQRIINHARKLNPSVKILGVTATPERADRKGLLGTFDNVADVVTIGEMVKAGHLVPPKAMVIDIGTQKELSQVSKNANDYDQAEVAAIQNTYVHNQQIVENWQKMASGRSSVAFCSTIEHAIDVRDAFREAGIHSETIHSDIPIKERRAILKSFDEGNIDVLTNPMILTEGWDSQICSCIMLLRISSHKSTTIQMVGRGLRKVDPLKHPGIFKHDCLVMDFGISLLTHGDLETNIKLKETRQPQDGDRVTEKSCPECMAVIPIQVRDCPLCGYSFRAEPDDDGLYDEEAEIRLIEIDLINKSPFRWVSLYPSDKVSIASGFSAWVCVCTSDSEDWYAIGGHNGEVKLLTVANRIGAIGSADDFMRQHESSRSAKKAAHWMVEPISQKQWDMLARFGTIRATNKIQAAAHLTFRFNQKKIEKAMSL